MPSGSLSRITAPTYRASAPRRMRTSVVWVAGAPSVGSNWTKSVATSAVVQAASFNSPSTTTRSAVPARKVGGTSVRRAARPVARSIACDREDGRVSPRPEGTARCHFE